MKPLFIGVFPNFEEKEYGIIRQVLNRELSKNPDTALNNGLFQEFSSQLLKLFYPRVEKKSISVEDFAVSPQANLYLVDAARSAFYVTLKALNLPEGSEVLLPGFTCVVIVNPVKWAGLTPIFVDIDPTNFNTSISEIVANVTDKTKVILVQHTFGAVIDVVALKSELAKISREDIIIVEDLAHTLGGETSSLIKTERDPEVSGVIVFKKKEQVDKKIYYQVGTKADFALMTFGVEKAISTIIGGGVLLNKEVLAKNPRSQEIIENLQKEYRALPEVKETRKRKLLLNPLFWNYVTPLYYLGLGKFTIGRILVALGHKINFLGIEIAAEEYGGGKPDYLPAKYPKSFAAIGLSQLEKLQKMNKHRRDLAQKYNDAFKSTSFAENSEQKFITRVLRSGEGHNFLRYPLVLKNREQRIKLFDLAKQERIILGDWYKTMFYTKPECLSAIGYELGTAANAEDLAPRLINLPTSINTTDSHAEKIIELVKKIA